MSDETFLFDTYALIELVNKNPKYEKYLEKNAIINDFIFAEFCYNLIKDKSKNMKELVNEIKKGIIHAEPQIIEEAMQFRYNNKKKNLSMTDCISYLMAKKLDIKFLTGDKEFENLENVEFVRK